MITKLYNVPPDQRLAGLRANIASEWRRRHDVPFIGTKAEHQAAARRFIRFNVRLIRALEPRA